MEEFIEKYTALSKVLTSFFLIEQFDKLFEKLKKARELPKDTPGKIFEIFSAEGQFRKFLKDYGYLVDETLYDWVNSWGLDILFFLLFLEIPVEKIIGFEFLKLKNPFLGHTYFSLNPRLGFMEKPYIVLTTSDPDFQSTLIFNTADEFHVFLRKNASGFGVLLEPERKPMVEPSLSCEIDHEPSDVSVPTPPSSDKFDRLKSLLSKLEIKPSAAGGGSS